MSEKEKNNERSLSTAERLEALHSDFVERRPSKWEQIPDIDLYMDQVIGYMKRQHIGLEIGEDENLTSAMINNYIKSGVLPRAHGKKYDREHIGYLTAICLLKQVLSVSDSGKLLEDEMQREEISEFYDEYTERIDREYKRIGEAVSKVRTKEEISRLAMDLAVKSYAEKLACQKLVKIMEEYNSEE